MSWLHELEAFNHDCRDHGKEVLSTVTMTLSTTTKDNGNVCCPWRWQSQWAGMIGAGLVIGSDKNSEYCQCDLLIVALVSQQRPRQMPLVLGFGWSMYLCLALLRRYTSSCTDICAPPHPPPTLIYGMHILALVEVGRTFRAQTLGPRSETCTWFRMKTQTVYCFKEGHMHFSVVEKEDTCRKPINICWRPEIVAWPAWFRSTTETWE